jgi:hypothetical protein
MNKARIVDIIVILFMFLILTSTSIVLFFNNLKEGALVVAIIGLICVSLPIFAIFQDKNK